MTSQYEYAMKIFNTTSLLCEDCVKKVMWALALQSPPEIPDKEALK